MKSSIIIQQTGKFMGLLVAGIFLGWLFFGGSGNHEPTGVDQHIEESHTDEEGNIVYTCSMHPQIRRNEPGNCPICGMELIPVGEAEEQGETILTMTEAAVKLADIQTTHVDRRTPQLEVRLPGRVAADERRVSSITAQFPGRIEELYVDFTGTYVEEGEKLASIYSPELISAQRELLEAARNKNVDSSLYESTRRKLHLWGLPASEIERIETSGQVTDRIPISATRSGYVIQKNVDVKDYVEEGTVMYKVADLSRLWVLFDAYETDIGAVDRGDQIDFTVRSHPGKSFEAKVTYIDPFINPQTRTARVRAEVENHDGTLKPEMLARGTIQGTGDNGEELLVPRSAVMWTGKRSIVFVKRTGTEVPTFEPRLVTLGQRAGDYYVIEEGVEEGEEVVTHGNFKLDSAAQLADKLSMMNRQPGQGTSPAGHNHGSMEEIQIERSSELRNEHTRHTDRQEEIGSSETNISPTFRGQLSSALNEYFSLKNALVDSDAAGASNASKAFLDRLEVTDIKLVGGELHDSWRQLLGEMQHHAEIIAEVSDPDIQRQALLELSGPLAESVRTFGIGEVVYYQYCPMAFDNNGGYWLSESEKIRNPYQGEQMLNCGEIVEEIKNGS